MLTMIRLFFAVLFLAVIAYLLFGVDFGNKTLYQHFGQIAKTREARVLEGEIKKKAQKTVQNLSREFKDKAKEVIKADEKSADAGLVREAREEKSTAKKPPKKPPRTSDEIRNDDRRALNRLLRQKMRMSKL